MTASEPKSALLLLDLQNEYLEPEGKFAGDFPTAAQPMLAATRRLVAWARERQMPVIWVRVAYRQPGSLDAGPRAMARANGALAEGTWGAEIAAGLGRLDGDPVITKKRGSAFFGTDLNLVLRGLGVERLIVGGISTNWAVESTVRDGHSHDYEIVVVREATATPFEGLQEASLRSMATVFAEVKSLAEVTGEE